MVTDQTGTMPRWARNLAERERHGRPLTVRWMKCGRGCPHGRAFPWRRHIRIYASGDPRLDKFLLVHELAHIANLSGGHDAGFYRQAIRIATREGCLRGFLGWQGRRAKAEYRRMLRCDHRVTNGLDPAICQTCGRAVA